MNWLNFLFLIKSIYGDSKELPDLEKIQKMGLLAVKLCQIHALRIDFLDERKCRHLAKLYRNTLTLPPEEMNLLIDKNAPAHFRDNFNYIDEKPLASASIGQVHKAELKNSSRTVIKFIKKNYRDKFIQDVASVKNLFKLAIFFYPKLKNVADPIGILNDIQEYTLSELDLVNEMNGQRILHKIYEDNKNKFDLSKLIFPKIYENLSNSNVLVSEFMEGQTFDELLEQGKLDYKYMLELFHIHGYFMFSVGTFHGDIHPGNIILQDGKIAFIDTGFIGTVSDSFRQALYSFFEGLCYYDYEKCAYFLNQMADKKIDGEKFGIFKNKFFELYSDFEDSTVADVSLTKKMMETIKLGVLNGMVFEKGIFSIIRSLMYLDGMVLKCKPDAVLMKDMRIFMDESKKFST